jgi:RimJ/RimL family protein N-acetyltransferase
MSDKPAAAGRRATLRPYSAGFTEEELVELYRWSSDPDVLSLSGGSPLDMSFESFRETFLSQLQQRNSHTEQVFAILDEAGHMIGRTGLFDIDRVSGTAELGIVIGNHDCWGRGYGRDAVGALVEFGFGELNLSRIRLFTYPDNERARRAYEAVGFRTVRELQRFSLRRGTHSELEMEITARQQ